MLTLRQTLAATAIALAAPTLPPSALAQNVAGVQLAMMEMMPMGGGAMPQQGSGAMPMQNDNRMSMGSSQGTMQQMPGMASPGGPPAGSGGMANDNMMRMMQNMMRMGSGQTGMQQMPGMQGGMPPMGTSMPQANPGDTVRVDDDMMGMGMQGGSMPMGSPAARLEGRIAFLRAELAITPRQTPAWEEFANTLRTGREHLDAARAALQNSGSAADPMARLEAYESHLRQRVDAIHMTRMAFTNLFAQLDDTQKHKATAIMLPFIGRF